MKQLDKFECVTYPFLDIFQIGPPCSLGLLSSDVSRKLKKVVVESLDDVEASKGENSKTREKSKKSSSRKASMLKSVARALYVLSSPTKPDKSSNGVEAVTGVPFMLCIVATMCSNFELPM